eukprot:TRINITY_DN30162_c0_g1_i1.p1 TRINITY_DN30162_c0_g1~~TRINITY_DN30162_c0_g1_i1.p1  ORF type:complete len:226 (+),score=9.24 TRINITY_DN30162_c0_g1_i1:91-678(+)
MLACAGSLLALLILPTCGFKWDHGPKEQGYLLPRTHITEASDEDGWCERCRDPRASDWAQKAALDANRANLQCELHLTSPDHDALIKYNACFADVLCETLKATHLCVSNNCRHITEIRRKAIGDGYCSGYNIFRDRILFTNGEHTIPKECRRCETGSRGDVAPDQELLAGMSCSSSPMLSHVGYIDDKYTICQSP